MDVENERELYEYISKAEKISTESFDKKIRIAILSSFTIKGLEDVFKVKCYENKILSKTYLSGYNQYQQEILNEESQLYKFKPDIIFIILDTRHILGDLFYSPYSITQNERKKIVDIKISEIKNMLFKLSESTESKIVFSNFTIPTYSPYGICESKEEYGIKQIVSEINNEIQDYFKNKNSVYIYDFNSFITKFGEKNVFDFNYYYSGDVKIAFNFLPHLAEELVGYIKPIVGLNRKCIVLDLDNTLWGGVIGEDGFNKIKLGQDAKGKAFIEFQKTLLALYQRGIILAINSKNNPEDALQVIKEHPDMVLKEEHFAIMKINWHDKVSNMKEISNELNIGLDSMVFFDDDPINREIMKQAIPEIQTVDLPKNPSAYVSVLQSMNDFHVLKITDEDKKRGKMYFQQRKRKEFKNEATNLDEYLENMNISINIKKGDKFTIPRISQLTLKTNQFNLTTNRYQEKDLIQICKNQKMIVGCIQVEDKFGDNGITGAFIIEKKSIKEWKIDSFLLSCRVMGRDVEKAMLSHIIEIAKNENIEKIIGEFIPTKKNKPCENFLIDCGFEKEGEAWSFLTKKEFKKPQHVHIVRE